MSYHTNSLNVAEKKRKRLRTQFRLDILSRRHIQDVIRAECDMKKHKKKMLAPGVPYVRILLTEAVDICSMTRIAGARTIAHY